MTNKPTTSFPIEAVASIPSPGMIAPGEFAFSPDDAYITFLYSPDHSLVRQLFQFDPHIAQRLPVLEAPDKGISEDKLTIEEALRRERQRQMTLGVTRYAWASHKNRLLIPLSDGVYVQDGIDGSLSKIIDAHPEPALDPRFSPDAEWVSFIQRSELFIVPFTGGPPRQLTFGARETGRSNGLAEFIAQEEMDRRRGYWWSPDSQKIAFVEVDESHIPVFRIVHQGKSITGKDAQEDHHYPFAGQENARLRLGVLSLEAGNPVWMDLGPDQDVYLARVGWFPDGSLWAQIENRAQTELRLVRFNLETGSSSLLLTEINPVWINLHDHLKPVLDSDKNFSAFLWSSEKNGFRHLYLYTRDGSFIRQLTDGQWMVDEVVGVNSEDRVVYFTATMESPLQRHLYAVSLDGGAPRRITSVPGSHSVTLDHGFHRFIDIFHSLEQPPTVTLRSLEDDRQIALIFNEVDPRISEYNLYPPELVEVHNRQGVRLHGAVYRPPRSFGPGPFPTIVYVYGGPHAQLVTNGWNLSCAMRIQYLRSLGFLVFILDNRGSARRGLEFEGWIRHRLGTVEVDDQVDGVRWLVEQGLADPDRIGIYGWSYGGYMALMCLECASDTFKVAVSGAPVTAFDGYDTHYTERYMGTPQENTEGYSLSSPLSHIDTMQGKLLLVHGLIDENVHFRHTARLINALIQARKRYDLLLFPDERHSPRRLEDRVYMEECIRDYFLAHL